MLGTSLALYTYKIKLNAAYRCSLVVHREALPDLPSFIICVGYVECNVYTNVSATFMYTMTKLALTERTFLDLSLIYRSAYPTYFRGMK